MMDCFKAAIDENENDDDDNDDSGNGTDDTNNIFQY